MNPDNDITRAHKQEQIEAELEALDCTICPVAPDHPAFAAIIVAALQQPHHLTQQQIQDIIDQYEGKS